MVEPPKADPVFDSERSKRIQSIAILVIVVCLVPIVVLFASRALTLSSHPTPTVPAVIATPTITTALKKVGAQLEVTLTINDPTTEPLTAVNIDSLKVDGHPILYAKESLGALAARGTVTKRYRIPLPAKLKGPVSVSYDVTYSQGPYGGGSSSGFNSVDVK